MQESGLIHPMPYPYEAKPISLKPLGPLGIATLGARHQVELLAPWAGIPACSQTSGPTEWLALHRLWHICTPLNPL